MATKRTTQKKITLSEFKTWLAGVQSMQPEGWHPNKDNWAMILTQIGNIKETVVEKEVIKEVPVEVIRSTSPSSHTSHSNTNHDLRNPAYQAEINPADVPPSNLIEMPPINTPAPSIGQSIGDNGAVAVEIKDSDGEYESTFN